MTAFWFFGRLADDPDEPIDRILAVSLLGTEPPGTNDQHAVSAYSLACQADQTPPNVFRQRGGVANVEPELHRRGDLVDILPPRSRGPDELQLDFAHLN